MDEQQQSPVDVIIRLRKDLEEFQRTGSEQALRAACREALRRAVAENVSVLRPDMDPVIEHLKRRGLVRSDPNPRARHRHGRRHRPELPCPEALEPRPVAKKLLAIPTVVWHSLEEPFVRSFGREHDR
jgi:hypothetical protein